MDGPPIGNLLQAARDGARQAFLTKPEGTRYGAAVWTTSGAIFRSGQYSSFNHSTNIHAEMGALAVAAAAGDPDVVALALVSTAATEAPARPCGVCRQVIAEHALRVGRPIRVIMASWDGRIVEESSSEALLPSAWEGGTSPRAAPWVEPDPPCDQPVAVGDHLLVAPGVIGMVWGSDPKTARAWVKVKYALDAAGCARKFPHWHTEWDACQHELSRLALGERTSWGDRLVLVDPSRCPRIPRAPLATVGLERLRPLASILRRRAFVTGSHALGMARADSDIDIVIDEPLDDAVCDAICAAILRGGDFAPPVGSSTWSRMTQRFGDALELVRARRWCDTFMLRGTPGWSRISLTWAWPQAEPACCLPEARLQSPVWGVVTAVRARGKPTVWELDAGSGSRWRVETWHKDGVLVRLGDQVRVAGVMSPIRPSELLQFSPERDVIQFESMVQNER
jgi:cytidine deaminase